MYIMIQNIVLVVSNLDESLRITFSLEIYSFLFKITTVLPLSAFWITRSLFSIRSFKAKCSEATNRGVL